MSRETSPLIVGDFWLDKRRDGLSPDIWQIATYAEKSRSIVYRSTKRRTVDLEAAKAFLRSYEALQRSKQKGQDPAEAELVPHLFNFIRERGPDILRLDTVKSSFRAWIGFLMQDELGTSATVADITPGTVARFRRWRMGPHEWSVEWGGKIFHNRSEGVSGQAVQRNIEDLRAALNYADGERRIVAPKVPSVDKKHRQKKPKDVLTVKELGAIMGYAKIDDRAVWRELCLMLATGCRPGVAIAFDPVGQLADGLIDLHPDGKAITDKRNAVVPAIDPILPVLAEWAADPHEVVKSRRTWWRTARRVLDLPSYVEAYLIRHTITTHMDEQGVPGAQMSGIVGHLPSSRGVSRTTSGHYLHYDPRKATRAKAVLTKFFKSVMAESAKWAADHSLTIPERGKPKSLA